MNREELYQAMSKLDTDMTPDERIAAYLRGEEVDCQPYGLLAPEDALAHIWSYSKGEMKRSFELRCELIRRKNQEYGFTGFAVPMGLRGIGEALGSTLIYPENAVDYFSAHYVTDYSKLNELAEFDVKKNPFVCEKIEEAHRLMERFPNMTISTDTAGPVSTAIALRPIENVLRDMSKDKDNLHRLLELSVDCSLKWIEEFHRETGCTAIGIADPVTTTDILSPKNFQEFSKPYLKKLIDGIVGITGKKPSVHICGHTKKLWKDLKELGVDDFSLDNCENLEDAKNSMEDKVFLSGNVSPVDAMLRGSIDDVIEAVKKSLHQGCESASGFMVMTGCQVPIGTPKENIDAYIYAVKKYGTGARIGRRCKGMEQ